MRSPLNKDDKKTGKTPHAAKFITELSLWKNKAFIIWLVAVGLCKIGYLIPWVHVVSSEEEQLFVVCVLASC